MKSSVNFYIALLLITVAGAGATLLIVDVATTDVVTKVLRSNNDAKYASLQQSILKDR